MNNVFLKSLIYLIFLAGVLGVLVGLTRAHTVLLELNPFFFTAACISFILSITVWIISWGFLLKKHAQLSYPQILLVGYSAVFGSLTPVQLGTEVLRSVRMKQLFHVSYSHSFASSCVAKGTKFSLLALMALVVLAFFLAKFHLSGLMLLGFTSGLAVVLAAVFVFLLPLSNRVGNSAARFFLSIGNRFKKLERPARFFSSYLGFFRGISVKSFTVVLLLSALSISFEVLALSYSFASLGIFIALQPMLVLFVLSAILERAPFLPRGLGLVELVGFAFLSMPELAGAALSLSQIGGVLVVFDVVRLVVPTLTSILLNAALKLK